MDMFMQLTIRKLSYSVYQFCYTLYGHIEMIILILPLRGDKIAF